MTKTPDAEFSAAITAEHRKFKLALGQLTLNWSDTESALFVTLRHYACVSHAVASALFSGARATAMMSFIRSIAHNTDLDQDRRSDLEDVFTRIGMINTMRDQLTHHVSGSIIDIGKAPSVRLLTDVARVKNTGMEYRRMIGSVTVNAMCADLLECCWRLHAHRDSPAPFVPGVGPTGKRQPWLYTPPPPETPNRSEDKSGQRQKRPPKASRAKHQGRE